MTLDDLPDYVSSADLEPFGITPDDVRRRCPGAAEGVGLDGSPCWPRDELAPLLDEIERRDEP